jgi:O-methyltransferase involved in polyketide biosynthesis
MPSEPAAGRAESVGAAGARLSTGVLQGVSETLLIPLAGRVRESRSAQGAFHDAKGLEIADRIEFDVDRIGQDTLNMAGVVARTVILDREIRRFLAEHPRTLVINLGAGLCTRFFRVDNGQVRWIDLDLPDVIELKQSLVETSDRYQLKAGSAFDPAWPAELQPAPGEQTLIVAEGLLMYFPEATVKELFLRLAENYPGGTLLFEGWSHVVTSVWAKLSPSIRRTGAKLGWGLRSRNEVEAWSPQIRVVQSWRPGDFEPHRWGWLRYAGWIRRQLMAVLEVRFGGK